MEIKRAQVSLQLVIAIEQCQLSLKEVLKKHEIIDKLNLRLDMVREKLQEYTILYNQSVLNRNPNIEKYLVETEQLFSGLNMFLTRLNEQTQILRDYMDSLHDYGETQIKNTRLVERAKSLEDLDKIEIPGFCFVLNVQPDLLLEEWDKLMLEARISVLLDGVKASLRDTCSSDLDSVFEKKDSV